MDGIMLSIFTVFFKIGMFTFGGGYAMIPIMQRDVIRVHEWMSQREFLDIVGLSEMTPGVISVNVATFVGYRAGENVLGALLGTLGVILPSTIVVYIISHYFAKFKDSMYVKRSLEFIRPVVLGMIAAAAVLLLEDGVADVFGVFIAGISFYLSAVRKINPIFILIGMGAAGFFIY
ncbi:MAG TPA: chromate transporter [Eubacteriaceae bacterium]|nr:chromate transporter [Eubacteriaceae bacterium]